ncbi:MAG: HEAT repeat domain-containing protein [Planctomycetota bacterium]
MRFIAAVLILMTSTASAVDENAVLAAARAASREYQNHIEILTKGLSNADEGKRIDSIRTLATLHDAQAVPLILPFLEFRHRSQNEVVAACAALGRIGDKSAVVGIRTLTSNPDKDIREASILALHQIGVISAGDWMPRAKDTDDALRLNALNGLGTMQKAEAAEALILGLTHDKALIRQTACIGLGQLGDRTLGEKLRPSLTDANPAVRRYAAEAIAKLNYTPAIPDLLVALEANIAGNYVLHALRVMTREDFGFDPRAPLLMRQQAIERGFVWFSAHPDLAK